MNDIELEDFILEEFNYDNKNHIRLLKDLIDSKDSELISKDIPQFIINTKKCREIDNISNVFVINYKDSLIGLSFVNHHNELMKYNEILEAEIEIGLGLIDEYKKKHLGSLLEKELSLKLLDLYPDFDEIVARIDDNNEASKKAILKAGFKHINNNEYHFKK